MHIRRRCHRPCLTQIQVCDNSQRTIGVLINLGGRLINRIPIGQNADTVDRTTLPCRKDVPVYAV